MIRWFVVHVGDEYMVSTDEKGRFDHPLYVICKCDVEFDAHRIRRLLDADEQSGDAA